MRHLRTGLLGLGLVVPLLAQALVVATPTAGAATAFTVDSTLDEHDSSSDGKCLSTPSGVCTVRAAIEEVNTLSKSGSISVPAGDYVFSLGDIDITASPTIVGAGAGSTVLNGGGTARVFEIARGASVYIGKVTVRGGVGGPSTVFPGHVHGGAIHNHGRLILVDSTVRDSKADTGGGITNASRPSPGLEPGVIVLVNVTITANPATGSRAGGFENLGDATLDSVTISGNSGASAGGLFTTAAMQINNTIIGKNSPEGCGLQGTGTAETASSGNNLDSGSSCAFAAAGDRSNADPLLMALAGDGTLPLATGSPAVDTGDNAAAYCGKSDQRGVARPQDGNGDGTATCDIGAYELKAAVPPAPSGQCDGHTATIVGTVGNDTIQGTAGVDVIDGLGGNDKIYGRDGADRICGGVGKDRIDGGGGADRLFGDAGADRLIGGPGNDRLDGGAGRDGCDGGPGKDVTKHCES